MLNRSLPAPVCFGLGLAFLLTSCDTPRSEDVAPSTASATTALSDAEREQGWVLLFNGSDFEGWRGFQREDVPTGWVITDEGEIHFSPVDGDINTGLITEAQYADFELAFDWKIAEGGNSGVFFRVAEGEHDAIWKTGPEYQLVDNANHPDGDDPLTAAASNYALHGPQQDHTRPAGEYNSGRIVADGSRVEHWLNGEKVVEYELWTDEWEEAVARTNFAEHSEYGRVRSGHIALQEGGPVWFRNIRIRPIAEVNP